MKAVSCERIYREKASGWRWDRPELHRPLVSFAKSSWRVSTLAVILQMGRMLEELQSLPRLEFLMFELERHFFSIPGSTP